jgi:ankyrin repeat protein
VIQFLADEGCDLTAVDRFGRTPLFEAAVNQHTECITLLKMLGADLHVPPSTQASLLCGATSSGDASLLRMLLLAGANPASGDYDGRTAIHLAACTGSELLAKLLLDYLDTDETPVKKLKDRWGHTPLDDAKERGFTVVAELFKTHERSSNPSSRSRLSEPDSKKNATAMMLMGAGL